MGNGWWELEKNGKLKMGEYLFLLDTLFVMRFLIFSSSYRYPRFFSKRSIKKTRQIFANQQIFDELARKYHK